MRQMETTNKNNPTLSIPNIKGTTKIQTTVNILDNDTTFDNINLLIFNYLSVPV